MVSSFDRLQKEIDALTYNARSVLQALQEATVYSGSSKGFTVIRSGKQITLSRIDIYRLYKFYKDWENNNFSLEDTQIGNKYVKSFNTLRIEHDSIPVKDDNGNIINENATTTALAKHGRLLYLNKNNISSYDDDLYWVSLIASANNPKLVTNSSPIPINIRTPVFDPNLSTTNYNLHPTYLFPFGYYKLDLLGYSGDDVNHIIGGKSWTINADDFIRIESKKISVGDVDPATILRNKENRVGDYSFVWGYDTHAPRNYSTCGGFKSYAMGISSVSIGSELYVGANYSATISGKNNNTVSDYSGVFAGRLNQNLGFCGVILGGRENIVGNVSYDFIVSATSQSNDCIIECSISCNDNNDNNDNALNIPAYQEIVINAPISKLSDWKVGDTIILHSFVTNLSNNLTNQKMFDIGGNGFESITRTITSISAHTDGGKSILKMNLSIPFTYIYGGKVALFRKQNSPFSFGAYSAAIGGYGLVAQGYHQTVIGKWNKFENKLDCRFIIGNGSSLKRKNILEVTDNSFTVNISNNEYGELSFEGVSINSNKIYFKKGYSILTIQNDYINVDILSSSSKVYIGDKIDVNSDTILLNAINGIDGLLYLKSDNFIHETKSASFLSSDNYNIYVKNGFSMTFGKLNLFGNTYGSLFTPSSCRSFKHVDSINGVTPLYSCVSEVTITPTNYTVYKDVLSLGLPVNSSSLYTSVGDAHLITFASEMKDNGRVNVMQFLWGQCTDANINGSLDTGYIFVRKASVIPTVINGKDVAVSPNGGFATQWDALATHRYIDYKLSQVNIQNIGYKDINYTSLDIFVNRTNDSNTPKLQNNKYSVINYNISKVGNLTNIYFKVNLFNNFYVNEINKIHLLINLNTNDVLSFLPKNLNKCAVYNDGGLIGYVNISKPNLTQFNTSNYSGDITTFNIEQNTLWIEIILNEYVNPLVGGLVFEFNTTYRNRLQ